MSAVNVRPVSVPASMSEDDVELLATAQHLLAKVWQSGRHEVATALRTADGRVHTGVHVEGSCRRSSICAEGVAMGTARGALPAGAELNITSVVPRTDQRLLPGRHRVGHHGRRGQAGPVARPGPAAREEPTPMVSAADPEKGPRR
jgi:hypothetical protein